MALVKFGTKCENFFTHWTKKAKLGDKKQTSPCPVGPNSQDTNL